MLNVEPLFPDSEERMRAVFYPSPMAYWVEDTGNVADLMLDNPGRDRALIEKLSPLDPVGRALLLELVRYRYKPGWTFELRQHGRGSREPIHTFGQSAYTIKITMTVPDSRWQPGPGKGEKDRPTVRVSSRASVWDFIWLSGGDDPQQRLETFMANLREAIRTVEEHETDEWFRRDGVLVHDPHAQSTPSKIGPIE